MFGEILYRFEMCTKRNQIHFGLKKIRSEIFLQEQEMNG